MWYGVNLLLKSTHADQPLEADALWEECVYLLRADTEEEAREVGERIGKTKEHEYTSATGELVRWTFEQVESVCEILDDTLEHGTEAFSRFLRASEVESILTPFENGSCDPHVRSEST